MVYTAKQSLFLANYHKCGYSSRNCKAQRVPGKSQKGGLSRDVFCFGWSLVEKETGKFKSVKSVIWGGGGTPLYGLNGPNRVWFLG